MKRTGAKWAVWTLAAALVIPLAVMAADMEAAKEAATPEAGKMEGMHGMQEKMDIPEATKLRMQVMMNAEVMPGEPLAIMALRDTLKLTEEQVGKLQAISMEAQDKAKAVLTDEQRLMMAPIMDAPMSMKTLREKLMAIIKEKHPEMMEFTCPMHPDVTQKEPGKCPTCGMPLEPKMCPMCKMMMKSGAMK